MHGWNLERERGRLENALMAGGLDFTATYMAVCEFHPLIQRHPGVIHPKTVSALKGVLEDSGFSSQTQSFSLYKEAADALASILVHCTAGPVADQAIVALKRIVGTATGGPQRASAEALGSLPISIRSPKLKKNTIGDIPSVGWQEILEDNGITACDAPAVIGRSLVVTIDRENRLVIKLASAENPAQSIYGEAVWMEHLCSGGYAFPVRFNIPVAIKIDGSYLFRLKETPVSMCKARELDPQYYAIGFIAHKDYFTYPNDHGTKRRLTAEEFTEVMSRNACLLGKLASLGMIHSAPIPLFHNRVQRNRRADHGLYEWPRGGRLDRWLDSCCYPNFGVTGIRDFEHLVSFKDLNRKPYYHIGAQLLSLLLVTGSYFRNKDRARVGLDRKGNPVDARDLFDKQCLKELIQEIFLNYYYGFAGKQFTGEVCFNCDRLASRMIEEMGVDRHMEEVLRVADQREMTDQEIRDFLETRGYSERGMQGFKKGVKDIVVYSGPHLGGFNERISLPELIESVGAMSALCIVGRYWREKGFGFTRD
jgi:hypothetical protein